jgi:hypothetical protein
VLTRADQRPSTLVEVLMRRAVRSDVRGALLETRRALEVLLTRVVLRGCDPAQDEYAKTQRRVLMCCLIGPTSCWHDHGAGRARGGGDHAGVKPERVAHERDGEHGQVVELACESVGARRRAEVFPVRRLRGRRCRPLHVPPQLVSGRAQS